MNVRKGIFCSIHRSYYCCGREAPRRYTRNTRSTRYADPDSHKWILIRPGEWHKVDANHPRGYRVRLSSRRMAELLARKVAVQDAICPLCNKPFQDLRDVTPDHIDPSSMGGAWRDDHSLNIQAVHSQCNFEKGSRRAAA